MSYWTVSYDDEAGFIKTFYDLTNYFLDLLTQPDLFSADYMDRHHTESLKEVFSDIYSELFFQNIPMVVLVGLGLFF